MTDATNTDDEVRTGAPEGAGAPEPAEETPETIEDLRAQLEEAQAGYARARADYANLERRSQEQRLEVGRAALADAVRGFLPVLDDLQRAIEAAEGGSGGASTGEGNADEAAWLEGVRLVAQKFKTVLEQHGVEEIDALGQPFDPTRHEAVGAAPGPEGQVVHLLQRGYMLRDRVIRPAMVMVGDGAGAPAPPGTTS